MVVIVQRWPLWTVPAIPAWWIAGGSLCIESLLLSTVATVAALVGLAAALRRWPAAILPTCGLLILSSLCSAKALLRILDSL
jgi:hypothetical protein